MKMVPKRVPPKFAPLYGKPGTVSTAVNDVAPHPLVDGLEGAPAVPLKTHATEFGVRANNNGKTLVGVHRRRNSKGSIVGIRRPKGHLKHGALSVGDYAVASNSIPSGNRYFKVPKYLNKSKIIPKPLH